MTLQQPYNDVVAERDAALALNKRTYCAYCGEEFDIEDDAVKVTNHIYACNKHPMRDAEAERDAALVDCKVFGEQVLMLGKEVDTLEQQRDQLRKMLEKIEWVEMSRFSDGKFLHQCPVCLTVTGHEHYSDCELHAALTSSEGGES